MPNRNKNAQCTKCNKIMRSDNLMRHQNNDLCEKYDAGSSQCPFASCGHHTTKKNMRRHIKRHHPEIAALSIEHIFEIAYQYALVEDAIHNDDFRLELRARIVVKTIINMLGRRKECFSRGKRGFIKYCADNEIKDSLYLEDLWESMEEEEKIEWIEKLIKEKEIYRQNDSDESRPLEVIIGDLAVDLEKPKMLYAIYTESKENLKDFWFLD